MIVVSRRAGLPRPLVDHAPRADPLAVVPTKNVERDEEVFSGSFSAATLGRYLPSEEASVRDLYMAAGPATNPLIKMAKRNP
jgi:hypothetical protein